MADSLLKHKQYLDVLCSLGKDSDFNKAFFKSAPDSLILVDPDQVKTLKNYSTFLHNLGSTEDTVNQKRALLINECKVCAVVLPYLIDIILKSLHENYDILH